MSFENLVFSVFQFIQGLVETPKVKKTVDQHLEEILYYTMEYMQITENQVNIFYKCYVIENYILDSNCNISNHCVLLTCDFRHLFHVCFLFRKK